MDPFQLTDTAVPLIDASLRPDDVPALAGQTVMMPVSWIRRPIPSLLEEEKVCQISDSFREIGQQVAFEVLEIPSLKNGRGYFAFGGCHRWAAALRLGLTHVKVKIVGGSRRQLMYYIGSNANDL